MICDIFSTYTMIYNSNNIYTVYYIYNIPISALISVVSTSILVLILLTSQLNNVEYIAFASASRASLA